MLIGVCVDMSFSCYLKVVTNWQSRASADSMFQIDRASTDKVWRWPGNVSHHPGQALEQRMTLSTILQSRAKTVLRWALKAP